METQENFGIIQNGRKRRGQSGDRMWVEMPHTDVRSERRKNVENINVTDSPEMEKDTCAEETVSAADTAEKEADKKPVFDKELFKRSVLYNVMNMYRKTLEEATPQQIFQAAS